MQVKLRFRQWRLSGYDPHRPMKSKLAPLSGLLSLILLVSACSGDANDTTTTQPTVPAPTTTSTSTTTTTLDVLDVEISGVDHGDLSEQIGAVYAYVGGIGEAPIATPAFVDHLATGEVPGDVIAAFTGSVAELQAGWVAVATWEADVLLATSTDGAAWTLVGGHLPSLGVSAWYGSEPHQLFIIGSDARTAEDPLTLRADSLHIVSVAPDGSSASIVGLPRDSYVETSYGGKTKFTNVMSGRGPRGGRRHWRDPDGAGFRWLHGHRVQRFRQRRQRFWRLRTRHSVRHERAKVESLFLSWPADARRRRCLGIRPQPNVVGRRLHPLIPPRRNHAMGFGRHSSQRR